MAQVTARSAHPAMRAAGPDNDGSRRRPARRRRIDAESLRSRAARDASSCLRARIRAETLERRPSFVPGQTPIPPAARSSARPKSTNMVDASLDCWLTTGRFNTEFESRLADVRRRPARDDGQFRLVGEPGRVCRIDVAQARRARDPARRRGHRRRRRLSRRRSTRSCSTAPCRCSSTSTFRPTTST